MALNQLQPPPQIAFPALSGPAPQFPSVAMALPPDQQQALGIQPPAPIPAPAAPVGAPPPSSVPPATGIAPPTPGPRPMALPGLSPRVQQAQAAESAIKPPQYTGKLGMLEKAGDTLGRLFVPGVEQRLGVGTLGYQQRLGQAEQQTANAEKEAASDAGTQKAQADAAEAWRLANAPEPESPNAAKTIISNGRILGFDPATQSFDKDIGPAPKHFVGTPAGVLDTGSGAVTPEPGAVPQGAKTATFQGPDGKPMAGYEIPGKGAFSLDGSPITNPVPYEKPATATPEAAFISEYRTKNPGATEADAIKAYAEISSRPSFPRVFPVTLPNGDQPGIVWIAGGPGGTLQRDFIPYSTIPGMNGMLDPNGNLGPKPTATVMGMMEQAQMTLPQAKALAPKIDAAAQFVGPGAGRWQEMMTGKVGADQPQVAGLMQDLQLYASAVSKAHFGASAPVTYTNALMHDFRLSQSPDDLKARIASANSWLTGYAEGEGLKNGPAEQGGRGAPPAGVPPGSIKMSLGGVVHWVAPGDVAAAKKHGATEVK